MEILGEGASAVVKKCRSLKDQKLYAAKIMRNRDYEKKMTCQKEYELMKSISPHPNVITAKDFIASDHWLYLVQEMAEGCEL